jgi:hypothetical protein
LAMPVLAIAAWIRTGRLRQLLDDRYREYEYTLSDLKGEIANLRRSLADVTAKLAEREDATSGGSLTETQSPPDTVAPPAPAAAYTPLPDRVYYASKQVQPVPTGTSTPQPVVSTSSTSTAKATPPAVVPVAIPKSTAPALDIPLVEPPAPVV